MEQEIAILFRIDLSFTENLSCDVAVVGAGPVGTGTSTAYEVAKACYKTIIFEEDPMVGIPGQCGEGLAFSPFKTLADIH